MRGKTHSKRHAHIVYAGAVAKESSPRRTIAPRPLAPRGDVPAPLVFHRGARAPFAVRWFGVTSLYGHARNFAATAIASEQIDSRDWMRPEQANETLKTVLATLGGNENATTLAAGLGRDVWIDFVADTGDDRDVSTAVAKMIFAEYELDGRTLPRGDVLLFGGDTAYPVASADEIYRRLIQPWNEVLQKLDDDGKPRVLVGIPGNHDWYDGLDGFGRLFRRSATTGDHGEDQSPGSRTAEEPLRLTSTRPAGVVARELHLDEIGGLLKIVAQLARSIRALWKGPPPVRRKRLALDGYTAVQQCSYFTLPLAPDLDVYAVDRQLGRLDFRQRTFFRQRREEAPNARVVFVAPDPAIAFGERWDLGARMLTGCLLRLDEDRILYLTGDMHHYERRAVGRSLHVIAGGGGSFLHGTRIRLGPGGPPAAEYPTGAMSRRLVAQVPIKLMVGGAGFIVHIAFALIASLELGASLRGTTALVTMALVMSAVLAIGFFVNASHKRRKGWQIAVAAVPFGVGLGLLPMALRLSLPQLVPEIPGDTLVIVVYAFLGALGFGLFLMTIAIVGLEHQQAFSVLSHPGYKHFVRMCVHADGGIEAWTIGKDDPIADGAPVLVDRFEWE